MLIRRVRTADLGTLAILTLGVDILLLTELTRRLGTDVLSVGAPWGSSVVEVAGIRVASSRVIAGGVALLLVAGFAAAFKYTDWGVAMRSAAEDGETASLMGIRLNRVAATAWALAGALAAIGGLFLTSFPAAGITGGVGLVALAAIPAVVLGGFDSPGGRGGRRADHRRRLRAHRGLSGRALVPRPRPRARWRRSRSCCSCCWCGRPGSSGRAR